MPNQTSFQQKVENILIERLGIEAEELDPKANLASDLNLSDVEKADLIESLEKEFKFTIEDKTKLSEINTLEDLIHVIEENSNEF